MASAQKDQLLVTKPFADNAVMTEELSLNAALVKNGGDKDKSGWVSHYLRLVTVQPTWIIVVLVAGVIIGALVPLIMCVRCFCLCARRTPRPRRGLRQFSRMWAWLDGDEKLSGCGVFQSGHTCTEVPPATQRGESWALQIGNRLVITPELYRICDQLARDALQCHSHDPLRNSSRRGRGTTSNTGTNMNRDVAPTVKAVLHRGSSRERKLGTSVWWREGRARGRGLLLGSTGTVYDIHQDINRTYVGRPGFSTASFGTSTFASRLSADDDGDTKVVSYIQSHVSVSPSAVQRTGANNKLPVDGAAIDHSGLDARPADPANESVSENHGLSANKTRRQEEHEHKSFGDSLSDKIESRSQGIESPYTLTNCEKYGRRGVAMLHVLRAYCFYRPDIGYVQGMSYLVGHLLLYMDEYTAFVAFANLLSKPFLNAFYMNGTVVKEAMESRLGVFEHMVRSNLPMLHSHLTKMDVPLRLYFFQWALTLYAKVFGFETLAYVWHGYFIEGEVYLYKVAVALLRIARPQLLGQPLGVVFDALQNPGNGEISPEQLQKHMHGIQVSTNVQAQLARVKSGDDNNSNGYRTRFKAKVLTVGALRDDEAKFVQL
eukprot:CAMPEP_0114517610 /NCGR_PEP_ID=MMETSP0109-20121206/17987_1 /TAXON_ID=29199 /ORGANISM="Chlorarachnion reptans, Strain CCCM449" /LENGTH=602 /DNA_ID=CAMNT_0001698145 /DNA_START=194 /DNA_END=2001 /DNA_ORIENTATION=+